MATNDEIIDADVDDYLKNPKGNLRYWEIDRVKNMMNQARQDEASESLLGINAEASLANKKV
jgi:hypothetical protein